MSTVITKIDELIAKLDAALNTTTSNSLKFPYRRIIIIGDIHGCFDELLLLLKKLNHNPNRDRLYLVGDLVTKGPKSQKVVEYIRKLPNTFCVMGNHDYQLLKCSYDLKHFPFNMKFIEYLKSFSNSIDCPEHCIVAKTLTLDDIAYLNQLPLYCIRPTSKELYYSEWTIY